MDVGSVGSGFSPENSGGYGRMEATNVVRQNTNVALQMRVQAKSPTERRVNNKNERILKAKTDLNPRPKVSSAFLRRMSASPSFVIIERNRT